MANINLNNGLGADSTVKEALEKYSMETLVNYMDDEIREQVHCDLAPCSDEEFLEEYLKRAPHDLIIG